MQSPDDSGLLRQFVENQSNEAFASLVTRYINLVYSVALRQTGNAHNAEEITQAVFIILAKKALQLRHDKALSSWLFQTTRLTANNFIRSELRRQRREEEACMQSVLDEPDSAAWSQIAPLLDGGIGALREKDRRAILLRFYEGRNLREVGEAMGVSEDAAEKRVVRALEKLRRFFTKRGVDSTTAVIAGVISANSVQVAPVALAKTVTALAIAKGAVASGSSLTLIKGALKIMAWTKVKTMTVAALAVIVGTSITTVAVKQLSRPKPVVAAYPGDSIWKPYSKSFDRVPPMFLLQPSTLPAKTAPYFYFGKDGYLARGQTVKDLITTIWSQKDSAMKLVFAADLPDDKYDFIATAQPHWWRKLESEVNQRFNLVQQIETRDTGVVVVVKKAP